MSKKLLTKVLAIATGAILFAGAFVTGVGAPARQVSAAVDASVKSALKGVFDSNFYAQKYADVKAAYGTNFDALFNHFSNNGMKEGRMVNANFDPKAYIAAYPDVAAYCNGDYEKAYEHYVKFGMGENRQLTTFAKLNAQGVPAPAAATTSSSSGSSAPDKEKVDLGYGITVYLTKEQMDSSHIEVVKSEYGYGAFLVNDADDTNVAWLGGTKYYFPFEGGDVVQTIDLGNQYVDKADTGWYDGNDVSTNYIPTWGSFTNVTSAVSNGIPANFNPLAENEAVDWAVDDPNNDTLYGVRVGFADYNQVYAETAVDIYSPETRFFENTESQVWDIPWGGFVW